MKQKKFRSGHALATIVVVAAGLSLFASCAKEKNVIPSPSYSIADFVGYYMGVSSCNSDTAYFVINAGKDRTTVTTPAWFGLGECQLITNVEGKISGNVMTIDSAYFQDKCFGDYYIDATGTLINDSMFLTVFVASPTGNATCVFSGRKMPDTLATQNQQ